MNKENNLQNQSITTDPLSPELADLKAKAEDKIRDLYAYHLNWCSTAREWIMDKKVEPEILIDNLTMEKASLNVYIGAQILYNTLFDPVKPNLQPDNPPYQYIEPKTLITTDLMATKPHWLLAVVNNNETLTKYREWINKEKESSW